MQIVQVVKNYGLVGGMEEYVFRLTEELSLKGVSVTVLCEREFGKASSGIEVVVFGGHRKPHWISHFRFSAKVDRWLRQNPKENRIVHSHERQSSHQVSTFHTTPFNFDRKRSLLHRVSPRHLLFERLEKREIVGNQVKAVVPVSSSLGEMLEVKHPSARELITPPIHPGVALNGLSQATRKSVPADGGVIGFMGKEWQRKGLPQVISVWRELKKERPKLAIRIAGVSSDEIIHLFGKNEHDYEVLGFIKNKESFYESIDLLLHPAQKEAFGMVITEAMTSGVPVLCSTECGAAELVDEDFGIQLPFSASIKEWYAAASAILKDSYPKKIFSRAWHQVATEYLNIYKNNLS
jgi:UDP-glucose:(heptosyl)LPS alpha-1,3-glucosyltransferase